MATDRERLELIIGTQMEQIIRVFEGEFKTRYDSMVLGGMDPKAALTVLKADQVNIGRTFGQYKNGMKNLVLNAIRGSANVSMFEVYEESEVELFIWVTVSGDPCPQCLVRQGEVLTLEGWRALGLPKSGFSVCTDDCKCVLLPEGFHSKQLSDDGFLVKL